MDNITLTIVSIAVAIIVPFIIYLLQSKQKSLAYRLLVENKILSNTEISEGRVKVTYDDREVNDIVLLIMQITNIGNIAIEKSDFDSSIIISFFDDCQVLSTEVIKKIPEDLEVVSISDINSITLKPLLLNSGDGIVYKILVSKRDYRVAVNARIKDVKKIVKMSKITSKNPAQKILINIIMLLSISHVIILLTLSVEDKLFFNLEFYVMIFMVAAISSYYAGEFLFKKLGRSVDEFLKK
ncbi:MAG: hypothetical protein JST75_14915 [Bacteroidetes bacterium]|nr:hypothetical protein [Bacteroidota bacterium]